MKEEINVIGLHNKLSEFEQMRKRESAKIEHLIKVCSTRTKKKHSKTKQSWNVSIRKKNEPRDVLKKKLQRARDELHILESEVE
jgi:hypothetical protein